jgi:hypothetical protein
MLWAAPLPATRRRQARRLLWPKRLGAFPFWRGEEDFLDALVLAYQAAGARGMAVYLALTVPSEPV